MLSCRDAFGADAFWAKHLSFWALAGAVFWPRAFWAGVFWAAVFLPAVVTFFAGTLAAVATAAAAATAPLATGAFYRRHFKQSCPLKFLNFILDYSISCLPCLLDFAVVKISHFCFPFSGFNLCGTSCGCPFCIDIVFSYPGFLDILLVGTVWKRENEISQLHAFKRHGLSCDLHAGSIYQSPVLISDIYNRDQVPDMSPQGDIGHKASLQEAPECHVSNDL